MNELLSENSLIFEHMFQYTPVGIAIISPENGAWIKINPALCLMLGYSESELLAMSYLDITYPDDAHIDHSLIVGKIAEESSLSYEFEKRYVHQNGSIIWVSMHISLVLDEQTREPLYYIAQVIDISEKKEAEQKLIENQKLFQLIDDNALDLITSSKPDGTLLYCSPSIFTLLGYTQEEMLGTNRMDYYHPDDQEKLIGAHYYPNNMLKQRRVRYKDGHYMWFETSIKPEQDEYGNVEILGISRNITDRKIMEELIQEREKQFRHLAENSLDFISRHTADEEATYLYASPAAHSLLGYDPNELIGSSAFDYFHPDDIYLIDEYLTARLLAEGVYTVTYRIRHKDGHYIWFESTGRYTYDETTGAVQEIIAISRDITDRKQAEKQLKESGVHWDRYSQHHSAY